jgi:3-methyladenine DNA glycosylase/8-oxoguanine DNA glycosylase
MTGVGGFVADARIKSGHDDKDAGEAVLSPPWPIDLTLTVMSHGWAQLAPWSWDAESQILSRPERIAGHVGTIAVEQSGSGAIIVHWDGLPRAAALACARRWLSADWEPGAAVAAFEQRLPAAAALIARGGGRVLRCSTFYEDFVKTLLTVNTSWAGTCRMAAALVAGPGGGAFPGPSAVLDYGERRLRDEAKLGFRAPTLVAATGRMLEDGVLEADGAGAPDHAYLIGLKGIGPYAAAHCRLLLQDFARLPVDSSVTAWLRDRHGCAPDEFAARHEEWGPYLALGYRLMRLCDRLEIAGAP